MQDTERCDSAKQQEKAEQQKRLGATLGAISRSNLYKYSKNNGFEGNLESSSGTTSCEDR